MADLTEPMFPCRLFLKIMSKNKSTPTTENSVSGETLSRLLIKLASEDESAMPAKKCRCRSQATSMLYIACEGKGDSDVVLGDVSQVKVDIVGRCSLEIL